MSLPTHFELESPAWLRNLRWVVVGGIAAAVAGARIFGAQFESTTIFLILGLFGLWNLVLPWIEYRFDASSKGMLFLQMLVDLAAITAVLWHSGGLMNPFVGFYIVNVLVAGLLLNSLLTVVISCFATICILLLLRAPPMYLHGEPILLRSSPLWFGLPLGLIVLVFLTAAFILVFLARLGRAQGLLRHRIKMDALGRLVAGLAHEIGTPLNSIMVLAKELESEVVEAHRKDMHIIVNQAKRCGEIVSLLLGYSRTMVRRSDEVKYTPVKIVAWIQETYDWLVDAEMKKYPDRARAKVSFRIEALNIPESISVPQLILRQVLENLLKNARDAVSREPVPQILLQIHYDPVEEDWNFVITDNGPGFTKEGRERAFEAFFSTKEQGFGSGLGLYISYYLLSQVGGRIAIDEQYSHGARMRVTLPRLEGLDDQTSEGA
ncbi:MAG TPA: HAMP domain-containing sensor histidine kinase [Bdellovibrionota bacterium]|jgi:signal transduction histidine kinase